MSEISDTKDLEIKQKHKPRSEATEWRQLENGGYYNGVINPKQYYSRVMKEYYKRVKGVKVNCDRCDKLITKKELERHKTSRGCKPTNVL